MSVYSILDFGARPGEEFLQTERIQSCIDACFKDGGGTVEIPAGEFKTGGLRIRSNVTLHLLSGAKLTGSRDPMDYMSIRTDTVEPVGADDRTDKTHLDGRAYGIERMRKPLSRWNNGLLRALDAENIAVIGEKGSIIDGMDPYDETGEEGYRGPHGMNFYRCRGVTLKGYTIQNTGNWAHAIFNSANVTMTNVTVLAGHDGIHITTCDNVLIENCEFYTGDDCIAGIDNVNVTARGCVLNTACSGLRFGGTNALFENCRFFGPARYLFRGSLTKEEKIAGRPVPMQSGHRYNMLSTFTYYADFTRDIRCEPGSIVLRNCTAENNDRFLHYNYSGNELWQINRPLKSIRFEHVTAKGIRNPVTAYGDADCPVRLELIDCALDFAGVEGMPFMWLSHWEDVSLKNVTVRGINSAVLVKTWSEGEPIRMENVDLGDFEGEIMKRTDEPFVCTPI